MKKFLVILILAIMIMPCYAINYGMYKPETEYGLIDGFKFNLGSKKKGQKFVQLKSETEEEKNRLEREKKKPKAEIDENEQYRFMRDGIIPY